MYYFEWKNRAIYRLDLSEAEELEKAEKIGQQPGDFSYPVLFQADDNYCV